MGTSIDELDSDTEPPLYLSENEQLEYKLARAWINLELLVSPFTYLDDSQLARLNAAVLNSTSMNIDFINNNDVIAKPTPKIIVITPEPTST